jgi:hypothetical protein
LMGGVAIAVARAAAEGGAAAARDVPGARERAGEHGARVHWRRTMQCRMLVLHHCNTSAAMSLLAASSHTHMRVRARRRRSTGPQKSRSRR